MCIRAALTFAAGISNSDTVHTKLLANAIAVAQVSMSCKYACHVSVIVSNKRSTSAEHQLNVMLVHTVRNYTDVLTGYCRLRVRIYYMRSVLAFDKQVSRFCDIKTACNTRMHTCHNLV
jgi:hypothetical protein